MLPQRMEDYADIFQEARKKTIPNQLPGSVRESEASCAFRELVETDPTSTSDSVVAEGAPNIS